MLKLSVTFAAVLAATSAHAIPISLYYDVTDIGGGQYQYNFEMVLDNNDGTHNSGDEYDWFSIGSGFTPDGTDITSPFTEGLAFFTALETGWSATSTAGAYDGPTLAFGTDVLLPGWTPNVGDSVDFTGVSSTLVPEGDLYFNYLISSVNNPRGDGSHVAILGSSSNVSPVPVPATLPLVLTGIGGLAFLGRRRRKAG